MATEDVSKVNVLADLGATTSEEIATKVNVTADIGATTSLGVVPKVTVYAVLSGSAPVRRRVGTYSAIGRRPISTPNPNPPPPPPPPPPVVNALLNYTHLVGANTPLGESGVSAASVMANPAYVGAPVGSVNIVQTSGPANYSGTGTNLPATAPTPVPNAHGVSVLMAGGDCVLTVTAFDAIGRQIGVATLTLHTVTSYTRPAYTRLQGRVTAANSGNAAMGAYTFTKVATISSAAGAASFSNAASSDLAILVAYGCQPFRAGFFEKVPTTGRFLITSEHDATPSTLQQISFTGTASINSTRCEAYNVNLVSDSVTLNNGGCRNLTCTTDVVIINCPASHVQNDPGTPFLPITDSTLCAQYPVGTYMHGNNTSTYVIGGDDIRVVGDHVVGPITNCGIEGGSQQDAGPDFMFFDSGAGPINGFYWCDRPQARPIWNPAAHPDFWQLADTHGTMNNVAVINARQYNFDGRSTAHGGPFMGTPNLLANPVMTGLTVAGGHVSYGIETHALAISNVAGVDIRGFGIFRQQTGVTGGIHSPNGTANTSKYLISGGGAHDGYGSAQYEITNNQDVFPTTQYVAGNEQFYASLNFEQNNLVGTVTNPTVLITDQISLNGSTVTLNVGTTLANVITAINNAAITNILAANSGNALSIIEKNGDPIVIANVHGTPLASLGFTAGTYGNRWSGTATRGISQGAAYNGYPNAPAALTLDYYARNKASTSTPPDYTNPAGQDDMSAFLTAPNTVVDWSTYAHTRAGLLAAEAKWISMYAPKAGQLLDRLDGTWNAPLTSAGKWNQYGQATLGFTLPGSASTGATVNGSLNLVAIGGSPVWDPYNTGILPQDVVSNIRVNGSLVATVTIPAGQTSAAFSFVMPNTTATVTADNDVGLLNITASVT